MDKSGRLTGNISKFVQGGYKVCDALPLLVVSTTYQFVCEGLGNKMRDLRVAAFQTECTAKAKEEFAGCAIPPKRIKHIYFPCIHTHVCFSWHTLTTHSRVYRAFSELKFYLPQLIQSMWHHQGKGKQERVSKNLFEDKALELLLLEQCVPIHWVSKSCRGDELCGQQDVNSPVLHHTSGKVTDGLHFVSADECV